MKRSKRIIGSFLAAAIMVGSFTFYSEDADALTEAEYIKCQIDVIDMFLGLDDGDFVVATSGKSGPEIIRAIKYACLEK